VYALGFLTLKYDGGWSNALCRRQAGHELRHFFSFPELIGTGNCAVSDVGKLL